MLSPLYFHAAECRFGNKVNWCGDITSENIDRICTIEDYQVQCCDTCRDYIGLTTTSTISSSTTTTTTTVAPTTSTRLPPVSDKWSCRAKLLGHNILQQLYVFLYHLKKSSLPSKWFGARSRAIGYVNRYPTLHYFGNPGHTQSMIAYMILTECFPKFQ